MKELIVDLYKPRYGDMLVFIKYSYPLPIHNDPHTRMFRRYWI